ncbi:hypothetical protein Tco_1214128 [Tanacetum coccineum]
MESFRCHFFNGVDPNGKRPIWVKWNNVLASKQKGGLGVSSLYALNRALLFKWVWRFYTQKESLWTKVIIGIHGVEGKLNSIVSTNHSSIWLNIVQEMKRLKDNGLDLCDFIHKKMGNGSETSFWQDMWREEELFKSKYPRIYALESNKDITVAEKVSHDSLGFSLRRAPRSGIEQTQLNNLSVYIEGVTLVDIRDKWSWSLDGSGEFSVASVRNLIDDYRLNTISSKTRWSKAVPIKINVHAISCH